MRLRIIAKVLFMVACTAACIPPAARAAEPSPLELKIKAAYLINFGRYVTWPSAVTTAELRICVVGQDPFGPILDRTTQGRKVQDRTIAVARLGESDSTAKKCDIAYISPGLPLARQQALLRNLTGRAVLTVGDSPGFLEAGGIVNFTYKEDTVRFAVNLIAARNSKIHISSRVLDLAVSVRGEDFPP